MDPNIQIALISGFITILVGIITALAAAYFGAIRGAKTQIKHERKIRYEIKKTPINNPNRINTPKINTSNVLLSLNAIGLQLTKS